MTFPYLLFLGSFGWFFCISITIQRVYNSQRIYVVMGLLFLIQVSAASPWSADSAINWTIPFFSLSLSLNIILTAAIVIRLLVHRQKISSTMGPSYGRHYTSVASMIVESASIFSVFSLLFLVPFALNHPLNLIFFQALSIVQVSKITLLFHAFS